MDQARIFKGAMPHVSTAYGFISLVFFSLQKLINGCIAFEWQDQADETPGPNEIPIQAELL
jgi:hypothetical protein